MLFIWVWRVHHPPKAKFVHLAAIRRLWLQNHEGTVSSLPAPEQAYPTYSRNTELALVMENIHGACENIIVLCMRTRMRIT